LIKDDFKVDGYRWYDNGKKKLPSQNPIVKKTYYWLHCKNGRTNGFQKHVYQLVDKKLPLLIHYIGDESLFQSFSHGNSKKNNKNFMPTLPSVLNEIKEKKIKVEICSCGSPNCIHIRSVRKLNGNLILITY
jgi:hypothetical protein